MTYKGFKPHVKYKKGAGSARYDVINANSTQASRINSFTVTVRKIITSRKYTSIKRSPNRNRNRNKVVYKDTDSPFAR